MLILGISAFYHDSAAALIEDGRIVAAAQEERFTRKRHDPAFPKNAISFCLAHRKVDWQQIDAVVFYEKPFIKFERLLQTHLAFAPRGFRSFTHAIPLWLNEKLFQKEILTAQLRSCGAPETIQTRLLFSEHHLAHAASAFYPSPFEESLVLTMDGVGEWVTTSAAVGRGRELKIVKEIHFPHSIGMLYSAFTQYLGFRVNSGEYKVMGLAPYGRPRFKDLILENLVDVRENGSFRLDMRYFGFCTEASTINARFADLFGGPPRAPNDPLTERHLDLAASIQAVTEEIVLKLARALKAETGLNHLCLAGGVALNCVANGKLLKEKIFSRLWVQPAAGDAGGAVGAALAAYHLHFEKPRTITAQDGMSGAYLGPEFSSDEIEARLVRMGARFHKTDFDKLLAMGAEALIKGQAVGWFQGPMEFGPRALGSRSILADPRPEQTQKSLNMKVKFRESFRPFAPAVLFEDLNAWFDLEEPSPYMLLVADVLEKHRLPMTNDESAMQGLDLLNRRRSEIPAVTHVDYSARLQTVHKETNPRFHALLREFKSRTGVPLLVNTSFNVRGEPIVCTPEDAFRCFMRTDIETLIVGDFILHKHEQDLSLKEEYEQKFELD